MLLAGCGEPEGLSSVRAVYGPLAVARGPAAGTLPPLRADAANPRYFSDGSGAVFLTGSHTWNSLQDWSPPGESRPFDYERYLDFLQSHGHNLMRLYVWEQAAWFPGTPEIVRIAPLPYLRTGPGTARDGGPRFDLTRFDPSYFERLHARVQAAGQHGIYVSVMLFDGWSIELKGNKVGNPWNGHPFQRDNNVNGVDGDIDHDGQGLEVHTLANPRVTELQKAYVAKVVDTLHDLGNVLWEIGNESHPGSADWQNAMVAAVREAEARWQVRHPVGLTSTWPEPHDGNRWLWASGADWISPHDNEGEPYGADPPAATGRKVVLSDTDHIWGIGGDPAWVWRSFTRGLNILFMDPYTTQMRGIFPLWQGAASAPAAPQWEPVRRAMGDAGVLARALPLDDMRPLGELASSGYCLAAAGQRYVAFVPYRPGRLARWVAPIFPRLVAPQVEVDLRGAEGQFQVRWLDVDKSVATEQAPVQAGGRRTLHSPFAANSVLDLRRVPPAAEAGAGRS